MTLLLNLLSGDQTCFGSPALDDDRAARARADQLASVCRYTRGVMVVNVLSALIFIGAVLPTDVAMTASTWGFGIVLYAAFFYLKATAPRQTMTRASARTIRRAVLNACLLGALWASLPLVFFGSVTVPVQLLIICLCTSMVCGGAFVLASIPVAAIAFMMPIVAALSFAFLTQSDPLYWLITLLMFMYLYVLMRAVVCHGQAHLAGLAGTYAAQYEARVDPLTHLANRLALHDRMMEAIYRLQQFGDPFAVFYLDLDRFKWVNDEFGHFAGDQLLVQAAERLTSCLRDDDLVARIGGDEFAILCPGMSTPDAAITVADRILKAFSAAFTIDTIRRRVPTSIGIALAPADGCDADQLIGKADAALYRAKQKGRGTYRFSSDRHAAPAHHRRSLERDLRAAIGTEALFLEYQPFLSLHSGRITGFEALARWHHPELGTISPSDFIPVAEKAGLMPELGEQILFLACREAATWDPHLRVAVNFSIAQLHSKLIGQVICETLDRCNLAANRLEIEITESILIADDEPVRDVLTMLQESGVRIALDDFGTGYAALSSLRKLPLDRLKIDRSFVADLAKDPDCMAIVRTLVDLAGHMQIKVTAEGVETTEQMAILRSLQCSELQGYLVGRPVGADRIQTVLGTERQMNCVA